MFHFKHFSLYHENSALKISTDALLLAAVTPVDKVKCMLDIGCGCGVIAYCLAWKMIKNTHNQEIIGIDIDLDSIEDALKNKEIFPQRSYQNIHFYQQSIQDFTRNHDGFFDLIVSNPPFFENALKADTPQKNISKHNDTLPFEDLKDAVCQLLDSDGSFYLILPANESVVFEQISQNQLFKFYQLLIQPTSSKPVNRIVTGFRLKPSEIGCKTEKFCLRNANNSFSEPYQLLMEDFLLS